jgi:hypothetical protein
MERTHVTKVGKFEISPKYIERVRQDFPDVTFVLDGDWLVDCTMNPGTGKYGPLAHTGENWGWHLIRPDQFKPGLATVEGQNMAIRACGEAAKAKLNRPNFDHYSFSMPREVGRGGMHYTSQQEANLLKGTMPMITDRSLQVNAYDIEINGTEFYKSGGLDLTGVSVLCLFSPMLEIKEIKTMDIRDKPPSKKAR